MRRNNIRKQNRAARRSQTESKKNLSSNGFCTRNNSSQIRKMDLKKLVRVELIGLNVKVIGKNIHGKIIDETKNSILIETQEGKRKMILKNNGKFEFSFPDKKIVVNGKKLIFRPEERIKKR